MLPGRGEGRVAGDGIAQAGGRPFNAARARVRRGRVRVRSMRVAAPIGDVATSVGMSTGLLKNCKVGDAVVELGPESAAPASEVVVEAQGAGGIRHRSGSQRNRRGPEESRRQVGLFIFSRRTSPPGLDPLCRMGSDVFAIWDPQDTTTDPYFRASFSLARALCIRQRAERESQVVDFSEIDEAILTIEAQSSKLEEVEAATRTIRTACEKIDKRIGVCAEGVGKADCRLDGEDRGAEIDAPCGVTIVLLPSPFKVDRCRKKSAFGRVGLTLLTFRVGV